MKISNRISNINVAITSQTKMQANKRNAQGKDIIDLGLGDINFGFPKAFVKAVIKSAKNQIDSYTEPGGPYKLRQAIAHANNNQYHDFYKGRIIQPNYSADEIVHIISSKLSICVSVMAITDPGDEIIILAPYWPPYIDALGVINVIPKICYTTRENNFFPTHDQLIALITEKTKGIIINTPHNPTGRVYTQTELKITAEIAKQYNLTIISDEVYDTLTFDDNIHYSIAAIDEQTANSTIVIKGLSKGFGMGGLRFGYAMSKNEDIIQALKKIISNTFTCAPAILQDAAQSVFLKSTDHAVNIQKEIEKRIRFTENVFCNVDIQFSKIEGTFYIFPDISQYLTPKMPYSQSFVNRLINETGIVALPGIACGNDNYIRIALIQDIPILEKAWQRFIKFINT